MRISEFIERSNRETSARGLFELLTVTASEMGFDRLAYGVLGGEEKTSAADPQPPAVLLNYPADWVSRYFERGYQNQDPIVRYTPVISSAYSWGRLASRFELTADQRVVLDEAREAGLRNGASVPLHGPWGRVAVVSFAADHKCGDIELQLGRLQAIAAQFHAAYDALGDGVSGAASKPELSAREKECLQWVAQGKSSWDIGMILGISEFTVNFHIKKAMRKFETSNRTVAVVKAIRHGLIQV